MVTPLPFVNAAATDRIRDEVIFRAIDLIEWEGFTPPAVELSQTRLGRCIICDPTTPGGHVWGQGMTWEAALADIRARQEQSFADAATAAKNIAKALTGSARRPRQQ